MSLTKHKLYYKNILQKLENKWNHRDFGLLAFEKYCSRTNKFKHI